MFLVRSEIGREVGLVLFWSGVSSGLGLGNIVCAFEVGKVGGER